MTQDLNQEYDKIYLHQLQSTSYLLVMEEIISFIVLFVELFTRRHNSFKQRFLSSIHDLILSLSEVVK